MHSDNSIDVIRQGDSCAVHQLDFPAESVCTSICYPTLKVFSHMLQVGSNDNVDNAPDHDVAMLVSHSNLHMSTSSDVPAALKLLM